jgi:hypothetical protein
MIDCETKINIRNLVDRYCHQGSKIQSSYQPRNFESFSEHVIGSVTTVITGYSEDIRKGKDVSVVGILLNQETARELVIESFEAIDRLTGDGEECLPEWIKLQMKLSMMHKWYKSCKFDPIYGEGWDPFEEMQNRKA